MLAHAASGESDVAGLANRWRQERSALLERGTADHRLLSVAVSVEASWRSPTMTEAARRLLAVLGTLPDGIALEHLASVAFNYGLAGANTRRRRPGL